MTTQDVRTRQEQLRGLRVLVVDNDPAIRRLHASLLQLWRCRPVVAEGEGDDLDDSAIRLAKKYRCQLALVDMRLRDDTNPRDWSGLALAKRLQPTLAIIVSGLGDRQAVRNALKTGNVYDFVGKEDGPEELAETMARAAKEKKIGPFRLPVTWSNRLSSAILRREILPDQPDVPDDEADELISRLFAEHRHVTLELIDNLVELSERVSAPRGKTRVFRATVDFRSVNHVVKLSRVDKIRREIENYNKYLKDGLPGNYRPEKVGEALLWDLGAVAYSYVGTSGLDLPGESQTFTKYYRATGDVERILAPLRHFFGPTSWGSYYQRDRLQFEGSLFEAYDAVWRGQLSQALAGWHAHDRTRVFPHLPALMINPTRWLAEHLYEVHFVGLLLEIVTHGDLHGDNLFVSPHHAWPIDFERTGPGPSLRDFVELIQDIVTRIAQFEEGDLPVLYALAVAICRPDRPDVEMDMPVAVREHAEARKAFEVVQRLLKIAVELAHYRNRRELLWGLLLNSLFVATLLSEDEADPRRTRSLLLASVICYRLERWGQDAWLPPELPRVEFTSVMAAPQPPAGRNEEPNLPGNGMFFVDEEDRARAIEALRETIKATRRRRDALEVQAARAGIGVDPAISTEIADLDARLVDLEKRLRELEAGKAAAEQER